MFAPVTAWQEPGSVRPKLRAPRAGVDGRSEVEDPREDPRDVCFDDRYRLIEGKGSNGICGVTADPRQLGDGPRGAGQFARVILHDTARGPAKVPSARVITEALPGVKNLGLGRGGKSLEVRETAQPSRVVRNDSRNLGLLEHEF